MKLWDDDTVYVYHSSDFAARWGTYRDLRMSDATRKRLGVRWPRRNFPPDRYGRAWFIEPDMSVRAILEAILVDLQGQKHSPRRDEMMRNTRMAIQESHLYCHERFEIGITP